MATSKPNRLLSGLSKVREAAGKAEPESAPASAPPVRQAKGQGLAASREGKVAITVYFDPVVRKQLSHLSTDEDKTQSALIAEALNLLFERYGKPTIAKA